MLTVAHLTKTFGAIRAIDDLSFSLAKGEFLGVIGPNGAGKTTLLNLITGYLSPTSGSITFADRNLNGSTPFQVCHAGIARTFQVVRPLAEMTVEDNLMTGALFGRRTTASFESARDACELPLRLTGLDKKRQSIAGTLTIGEKKKLELARALATKPQVLLLDEVMGGLPYVDVRGLIEVLRSIHASGVTILMIEHLVPVIRSLAERVLVLNFGKLLAEGQTDTVLDHPDVVEVYIGKALDKSEQR